MSIYRRRLMIANALKKSDSNINYPNLIAAWSAAGKSNDDADRNILRDLTGNGHDITLNGFAFSEMSGYGGYGTQDVDMWYKYTQFHQYEKINANELKVIINGNPNYITQVRINGERCILQFSEPNIISRFDGTEYSQIDEYTYDVRVTENINHSLFFNQNIGETIIIKSLPLYPDALVFDGVDDYGINEEMPIQTDYTIIVKRKVIQYDTAKQCGVITKRESNDLTGAFWFERGIDTWSYGISTKVEAIDNDITWQNKTSYNGTPITAGNASDTNIIHIGRLFKNDPRFLSLAFYSAYLFDRSLDEQEIKAFIRKYIDADYLLPSEIPTPDCYYDFTNGDNASETRDTIVDLSGNGNDAKAYNFAWNEEGSGYKNGALQFDGTDDYISLEAFDSGFQTILMLCNYSTSKILYDQRNDEHQFSGDARFVIFAQGNSVAYNWGNVGGVTYINGKLNSSVLANETVLKKHCICINNPTVTSEFTTTPKIGGPSTTTSTAYAKMSVFKFLGFKEALTEEQIQYVIKKYNLLDGVDEIEVS